MKSVSRQVHFTALARGIVERAGAHKVDRPAAELSGLRPAAGACEVSEFALASGEVVARRVQCGSHNECWLREDIAAEAAAALLAESAETNEVIQAVCRWALEHPPADPDAPPAGGALSEALVRAAFASDKRRGKLWGLGADASRRRAAYAAELKKGGEA